MDDLQERLKQCEQRFEQVKAEQQQHAKAAEEAALELVKLQGEFRLLQDLLGNDNTEQVAGDPNTISAVPEAETVNPEEAKN